MPLKTLDSRLHGNDEKKSGTKKLHFEIYSSQTCDMRNNQGHS